MPSLQMAPVSGFKYKGLRQEGSEKGLLEYLEVRMWKMSPLPI